LYVHPWFRLNCPVCLENAIFHPGGQVGRSIAYVDLTAGDVVPAAIQ
jgi:hypothetical protein